MSSSLDAAKRAVRMAKLGVHGDAREDFAEALTQAKTVDEKLQVFDAARTLIAKPKASRSTFETYAQVAIAATRASMAASATTQAALKTEWAARLAAKDLTRDAFSLAGFHPLQALKLRRIAGDAALNFYGHDEHERGIVNTDRLGTKLIKLFTERQTQLWK